MKVPQLLEVDLDKLQKKEFSTLYKKTSKGATQFWSISVCTDDAEVRGVIYTRYGLEDTMSPQETHDEVLVGKNTGKKNSTTPYEQACSEAQSRWDKKLKSGYVRSAAGAQSGEVDAIVEGGVLPMLAQTMEKAGHKLVYPLFVQPKLDGCRCIAIKANGRVTLWSRTRKPITSVPHIIEQLEDNDSFPDGAYDGELYNHEYRSNFEHIVHLVRQVTPCDGHEAIEYHIYDVMLEGVPFEDRTYELAGYFGDMGIHAPNLIQIDTTQCADEAAVAAEYARAKSEGYEGIMLRNASGLYVNKRSNDLVKMKEMKDAEFQIVGVQEGRGKLQGHVGSFVCVNEGGDAFNVKLEGSTSYLKTLWENTELWKGKQLSVRFQELTSYGIPRFPVGVAIRDYE